MISKITVVRNDDKKFDIELMGFNNTGWVFLKDGLEGFGEFEREISTTSIARGNGDLILSRRQGKKDRTIRFTNIKRNYLESERRSLLDFFRPDGTYKVYITYAGTTLWQEAEILKFKAPTPPKGKKLTCELIFLFPSPSWKSYDNFGKNIAGTTAMAAFPYCVKRDGAKKGFASSVLDFSRTVEIKNDGTQETNCRVEMAINGDVKNPQIIINGHYGRMEETYHEGDLLIMDFESIPPRVTLNGENRLGWADRTSEWEEMALKVGVNTIKYDADEGNNLMSVVVYYNKIYGAI